MNMASIVKQILLLIPQGRLSSAHPFVKFSWNQTRKLFRFHNSTANLAWIETASVDFFVSRVSRQLSKNVVKRPDLYCMATNWFSLTWSKDIYDMIPSFCLICRILNKLKKIKTKKLVLITRCLQLQMSCSSFWRY